MRKKNIGAIFLVLLIIVIVVFVYNGLKEKTLDIREDQVRIGESDVHIYIPRTKDKNTKLPLVFTLHGRGGDITEVVYGSGWKDLAIEEEFILVAPNYDAYSNTYDVTDDLIDIVRHAIKNYNVDTTRVYATGFSKGGAATVGLTRDYPEFFAAIAPMGWMVNMPDKDDVYRKYDMPFQVIQGTREYTIEVENDKMAVSTDEQKALRSLFLFNEMIDENTMPNYNETEYWGYKPDETSSIFKEEKNWLISNYYKDGYKNPFGQLVLIENAKHKTHKYEATLAWNFLKNFARNEDGDIVELN